MRRSDLDLMKERLDRTATFALNRYFEALGEHFSHMVVFDLLQDGGLVAEVHQHDDHFSIIVSTGTFQEIDALWEAAWTSTVLCDDSGDRITDYQSLKLNPENLADRSLMWLLLHELMHIRLGHMAMMGVANLVETDVTRIEEPTTAPDDRNDFSAAIRETLSDEEHAKLRPCLELEADNDATEITLGAYSSQLWTKLRIDASCIFVVMALIEKANLSHDAKGRTHPSASARFFTMLAQLFQYWLYSGAHLEAGVKESWVKTRESPNAEDFDLYAKEVLVPAVNDAVMIAMWAEATSFLIDLGNESAIFRDIFDIQYAEDLSALELQTASAQEWRELLWINEKIMRVTGLRD